MNDIDAQSVVMIKTLRTVIERYYQETGNRKMVLVALAGISARIIMDYGSGKEDREEALEIFDTTLSASIERIVEERDDAKAKHSES